MSIESVLIEKLFSLCGAAKELSPKDFYRKLRKGAIEARRSAARCPILCGVKSERGVYCGMPYYLFEPKEVETTKAILYLHGSAYMNPYRHAQVAFAAELATETHAKVYFPLYPKLPIATVVPCFAVLNNFYAFLHKKGEVALVGDSSGGALALSLAAARPEVREVTAISPWVNLSLSAEGRAVEGDVMLSLSLLDQVARLWAGGLSYTDPRLSPSSGDYSGKGLTLLVGEKELFRPDVSAFARAQEEAGASVTYLVGVGQQHCYPLLPTPEGKEARGWICRRLQSSLYGVKA